MSVDKWLGKRYKPNEYICSDFACDVWLDLTGQDITPALRGLLGRVEDGSLQRSHRRAFRELGGPVSPCLAIFQRPREAPHIGVFVRGRVLHLTELGVEFQRPDVAMRNYKSVRFALCNV